jgi:ubiquinone/menaquinone biosynthesis C-methylase UbiE
MILYIFLGFISLFFFLQLVWRLASRHYTLPCPSWLGWLVEMDNPFDKTYRAGAIVQHLDIHSGMKVLDVGCGPGRLTIPVARAISPGGEVVAIDIQQGMIRRAQQKAEAAGMNNIRFIHGGAAEAELERSEYDRALLVTVLGEIPDQASALRVIFDALKVKGILSITKIIFDPHFQSRKKILGLASQVGFREKDFYGGSLVFTVNLEKP